MDINTNKQVVSRPTIPSSTDSLFDNQSNEMINTTTSSKLYEQDTTPSLPDKVDRAVSCNKLRLSRKQVGNDPLYRVFSYLSYSLS